MIMLPYHRIINNIYAIKRWIPGLVQIPVNPFFIELSTCYIVAKATPKEFFPPRPCFFRSFFIFLDIYIFLLLNVACKDRKKEWDKNWDAEMDGISRKLSGVFRVVVVE